PEAMIFAFCARFETTPAALSAARSTVSPSKRSSSSTRTSARVSDWRETKPIFGRRRCSGIWPPTKPTWRQPPGRACCPFMPRAAVLPWRAVPPRPSRLPAGRLPRAGFKSFKRTSCLLDSQQIGDLLNHAAVLRRIVDDYHLLTPAQSETRQALCVPRRAAMPAFDQRQPDFVAALCHE